jgi:hypothetical protein
MLEFAGDLNMAVGGAPGASHAHAAAVMGILVWVVLVLATGWVWFVRGDLN